MKKIIVLIAVIFTSNISLGQDLFSGTPDEETRLYAQKLTEQYNEQLSLDGRQRGVFEKTVTEFLLKREEALAMGLDRKTLIKTLFALDNKETAEMGNILTLEQLRYYRELKKNLQPVMTDRK